MGVISLTSHSGEGIMEGGSRAQRGAGLPGVTQRTGGGWPGLCFLSRLAALPGAQDVFNY